MLIKTVMIILVAFFAYMHSYMGSTMHNRPIIVAPLVGLVLGDLTTGILVGATLELVFMGAFPIGASNLDAAAMTDLLEVVELSRDYNPELDVRVLLSRVDSRTKDADEMLKFLREQKLTVLSTRICERVAFRRSIGEGVTVQELGKDQAAIREMEAFFSEVQG